MTSSLLLTSATSLLSSPALASLWGGYVNSNGIGKGIVILQIVLSATVCSIMLNKFLNFHKLFRGAGDFRKFFSASDSIVRYFFQRQRRGFASTTNPLIVVYSQATQRLVDELGKAGPVTGETDTIGKTLSPASMALIRGVTEESLSSQTLEIEKGMSILAVGATIAPLLGLLGTVWGVMDAFQDMGAQGAVNLATVAPSLSTAMLTTVVGLFVAIPSTVSYNLLVGQIRRLNIALDGFADEYLARVLAEFGPDGTR